MQKEKRRSPQLGSLHRWWIFCVSGGSLASWDSGGVETDVSQGQVGEEEVNGCVEVGVKGDSQNDEYLPKHSDQVHGQEEPKEKGLQVWITWEAQEEEFWDIC